MATFTSFFGQTGSLTVTQDVVGLSLSGITFNSTFSPAFTVAAGQPISTTGTFTVNAIDSVSSALSAFFTTQNTISLQLTGTGGFTKTGNGAVTLANATSNYTGNVFINAGTLNIGTGTDANFGAAANTVTINGGSLLNTLALTSTRTFTIGASGATFQPFATLTLNGTLTGSGALVRNTSSAFIIGGDASGFTGSIKNETGTLTLNGFAGATQQVGGTSTIDLAGGLTLDNGTANNQNRLADTRGIISRGAETALIGNAAGTNEVLGNLTLESGTSVVTVTPNAAGQASLSFTGLTRNNRSTALFRGTGLGGTPAAAIGNILFTASPGTLVGGGTSPLTTSTASILPFAFGSTSATAATLNSFVTWDNTTNRIVPLDLTLGYSSNITTAVALDNVNQNATAALAVPTTINALRVAPAAAITISGSPLTITSGAILSTTTTTTALTTISANVSAPSGTEIIIHAQGGAPDATAGTFGGLQISGVISGNNGLTKGGGGNFSGVLSLTGANTYTGTTTLNQGVLMVNGTIANDGVTPGPLGLSTSPIVMPGGSFGSVVIMAAGGATTFNRDINIIGGGSGTKQLGTLRAVDSLTINGNINLNNPNGNRFDTLVTLGTTAGGISGQTVTVNGIISGNGGVTDNGLAAIITLNGANTYSGGTQLGASTYILGNDSALGTGIAFVTGTATIQAGASPRVIATPVQLTNNVTFAGTQNLEFSGNFDLNGQRVLTVNTTPGNVLLSGVVSRGSIFKSGAGTLILSNTGNTFPGFTVIQTGTVIAAGNAGVASGVLGSSTITNVGRVLMGNASSLATDNISFLTNGAFTIGVPIQVNANNTTGLLTIGGTNTSGTATFSGFVGLNRGPTPTPTRFTAATGGTVDVTGQIFDFVAGSTVDVVGTGTVKFSNNTNSYAGATRVFSGATLIANNTTGSATGTNTVTVNAGGTLGGNGIITGAVTNNGTISPGNSPGKLSINNNVTFGNNSNYFVQISGPGVFGGGTAGVDSDQLALTNATSTWTIGTGVTLSSQRISGYSPAFGDAYVIINNTNTTPNSGIGTFAGLADGAFFSFDGQTFQIRYNVPATFIIGSPSFDPTNSVITWAGDDGYGVGGLDNGGNIVIAAVPEPATIALMGLSGIAAIGTYLRLRRRNKFDSEKNLSSVKLS
ncbi:MAG: autotransporter-associated beta strand repeat-containing protein [Gemmatales bacterium]